MDIHNFTSIILKMPATDWSLLLAAFSKTKQIGRKKGQPVLPEITGHFVIGGL